MGQTFSSSSAGEQFYDIVLRCRPANLTTELGEKWDVEWPNRVKKVVAEVKQAGKAVGILGNFNRGKTWIMSQLSDFDLPDQGLTRKTEGLSMKWISTADKSGDPEEDEPYHLAIDTAGINSPIDVFPDVEERDGAKMESEENPDTLSAQLQRNKKMTARREQTQKNFTEEFNKKVQETEQYEHFLQTMTLQLADIIIVVMNETTFLDQNFLHNIVKKWRDLCVTDTSRYRQVYVIHNFRSTASIDERKKLFSSSTEKLYPGRKSEVNGVPIFVSGLVDFPTIHACLMFDDPKSRNCKKYNKSVFSLIKMWIRTCSLEGIAAKRDPLSLINRFEDKASMVLRKGFLANFKELRHLEKKNCISFLPEKANKDLPITRVKSREDRFYGPVTFVPPVRPLLRRPSSSIALIKEVHNLNFRLLCLVTSLKPELRAGYINLNCPVLTEVA
eukprot:m.105971 g.105971  ORF g.105971 m.105971 type:complete len:445 (+) comp37240_c1_seq4:97-1431(+)